MANRIVIGLMPVKRVGTERSEGVRSVLAKTWWLSSRAP